MKQMPKIDKVMTPMPQYHRQNISHKKGDGDNARIHIRHLPVQEEGKLVGIITDRDIKLANSLPGPG